MANRYTPEGLQRLYNELGGPGFWVPAVSPQRPYIGPVFVVYLRYSELFPERMDAGERLWQLLAEMPTVNAIGILATINNILSVTGRDQAAYGQLNVRFLEPDLVERVSRNSPAPPALGVVFNRMGDLVAMRELLLSAQTCPIQQIFH
jgi:hypothetical protein